jgi:ATP-binding protein involved in chromosome partitioning
MLTEKQKKHIEEEEKLITDNLSQIKHRIAVFSGKGGVGKTTVSVNIAHGLHLHGHEVGILDADITGPNVPKMTGAENETDSGIDQIALRQTRGVKVMSIANFIPAGQAVVWRGPLRSKLINQFLGHVEWGALDYLVADLPPGTGDEIITIVQEMRPDLAIVVTTPQELSLIDSARAVNLASNLEVPRIAIIENMSGFVCPDCGCKIDLFGTGGGKLQAEELNVEFLGAIPVSIEATHLADRGRPIVLENVESKISESLMEITSRIENLTAA